MSNKMDVFSSLLPTPKEANRWDDSADGVHNKIKVNGFRIGALPDDPSIVKMAVDWLSDVSGDFTVDFELKKGFFCEIDPSEAYDLAVYSNGARIVAETPAGFLYGAVTLKKLLKEGEIQRCEIIDYPDFPDRGLMLENRFGSDFMTLDDYKKAIDYLAEMKYNQLTIGIYGCWCVQYDMRLSEFLYVPLKSHPELQTPRDVRFWSPAKQEYIERENVLPTIFREDYFGDLIKYAASRNIKIKPLFNSFGHNTLIPRLHPELSAKDENGNPTKHGFCVSDDRVFDFMFSIYDEIIDRYLAPNGLDSIEIGLDEVYAWYGEDLDDFYAKIEPYCKCEKCRNMDRKELMLKFIVRVVKHLKSKGMRSVYIYHDMLFEQFDIVNEELVDLFKKEDIYDVVVLDWWCYTKEEDLFQKREINGLFRSIAKPFTGYYHWVIPMEYNENIRSLARLAKKHGFEGVESYSSFEYCFDRPFMYQAELSWNIGTLDDPDGFRRKYAAARFPDDPDAAYRVLSVMEDLTTNDTKVNRMNGLEYYWYTYVAPEEPYPRKFHESVYRKILDDYDGYMEYFDDVLNKAAEAKKFFDRFDTPAAAAWYLIAEHYETYSAMYQSVASLFKYYGKGDFGDPNRILKMLGVRIEELEDFMADVEDIRIEANSYVYLRNHSITLQFLCDLYDYIDENSTDGTLPKLDLDMIDGILSDRYQKLR